MFFSRIFREPNVFIFPVVAAIHFFAVETHSYNIQTGTVWAIRETAMGSSKAMLEKNQLENS